MVPGRISGVSMLPPNLSGTRDERTSRPAGATPTVPSIGATGSSEPQVAPVRLEQDRVPHPVELVDPGQLGQRLLQQRGPVGAGERAEERDRGRRAPVAGRDQVGDVQRERVAGLGALDVERAGLRVDLGDVQHLGRAVRRAPQPAGERVLGPQPQHGAGSDPVRRRDPAERPRVLPGLRPELHVVHAAIVADASRRRARRPGRAAVRTARWCSRPAGASVHTASWPVHTAHACARRPRDVHGQHGPRARSVPP